MDGARKLNLNLPLKSEDDGAEVPLQSFNSAHSPTSPTVQYYKSIFDRADTQKDGFITIPELQRMISSNSLTEEPIPAEIVRNIHKLADTNHDGRLDFEEFVRMINNPKFAPVFGRYVSRYINYIVPRKRLTRTDSQEDNLYEDQYSCWPPTLGMIIMSIIEIFFFLIDEFGATDTPISNRLIYDPSRRYEFWRFLSYMFVHIGHLHLTVNLVVQIFLGVPLEMVHGWWRVLLIYFSGVLAGSLGTSITDPTSKLAGASGGVYSLITAHIATIIMNWSEMCYPQVQLLIFLIITGFDVGTSIYNRYSNNLSEHIGYVAHLAGAISGLLVGILILKNIKITRKENVIWWLAIGIYVVLMLAGIGWNLFNPDYFPPKQ